MGAATAVEESWEEATLRDSPMRPSPAPGRREAGPARS
jgi:hypothetical protein